MAVCTDTPPGGQLIRFSGLYEKPTATACATTAVPPERAGDNLLCILVVLPTGETVPMRVFKSLAAWSFTILVAKKVGISATKVGLMFADNDLARGSESLEKCGVRANDVVSVVVSCSGGMERNDQGESSAAVAQGEPSASSSATTSGSHVRGGHGDAGGDGHDTLRDAN